MRLRSKAAGLTCALFIAATSFGSAFASSHREAPLISGDPSADNTDLYAFVSPDAPNTLTIIANFSPNQEPAGGPNFYPFDPAVRYEIRVDNNGDGLGDINYAFTFTNHDKATNFAGIPTFLYNDGPITSLTDPNWLTKQTYTAWKNGVAIGTNLPTPPANIGPRSTPSPYYANLGQAAIRNRNGTLLFAGQRDDPFFFDTGSTFDLLGLRPFNGFHAAPLAPAAGVDGLGGFNVNTIAIRVPIQELTRDHQLPYNANDPQAVVGVWASSSRRLTKTLAADGTFTTSGRWQQISRLGNPAINEVIIPRVRKDYWNARQPAGDVEFVKYYRSPEAAALVNVLYPDLPDARTSGRDDLVAILLNGLDLRDVGGPINLNKTGSKPADMLRVNTGIKPNAAGACVYKQPTNGPSRLGVLEGDLCGFPNGRRLIDDVIDIELRAIADGYGPVVNSFYKTLTPNKSPNNTLGDGVNANDHGFLVRFPYAYVPNQGYTHTHHKTGPAPS